MEQTNEKHIDPTTQDINDDESYYTDVREQVEMDMDRSDTEDEHEEKPITITPSPPPPPPPLSSELITEVESHQRANHGKGATSASIELDCDRNDRLGRRDDTSKESRRNNNNRNCPTLNDGNHNNNDAFKNLAMNIVQVVNVAPAATLDQLSTLFSFLGDIVNIKLYQSNNPNSESNFKVCFVEFAKPYSVLMAQHLTNTVFLDRALIVLPYNKCKIPDRETALSSVAGADILTNFNYGVVSQITTGPGGVQVIATVDPRLTALGLPQYPHLPLNTDPVRVEEIRRTVYVGNLDSTVPPDQVLKFFNDIDEVKYIRMAGDDTQPTRFAFVEYTHQSSIASVLQHTGSILGSRSLKISHSNNAIVKPLLKIDPDDVSRRVRENRSSSRDFGARDRKHQSSRYDRDRIRNRDRYHDRRVSPKHSRAHRSSRSRDRELSRRRSRSRDRLPRSRSRDRGSRRRSRSRDTRRRRSKSRSRERSRPSKHRKPSMKGH